MKMKKSKTILLITFLCISSVLLSQEKLNLKTDFVFIENIPKASQILTLKMHLIYASPTLKKNKFLRKLNNAKSIKPKDHLELLLSWHYSPWYHIEFTTLSGKYELILFLGGLGTLTLPNGKRGAVMFNFNNK